MSYLGPKSKRQFIVVTVPGSNTLDLQHGAVVDGSVATNQGGFIIAYAL
jgi:hypothetical protein